MDPESNTKHMPLPREHNYDFLATHAQFTIFVNFLLPVLIILVSHCGLQGNALYIVGAMCFFVPAIVLQVYTLQERVITKESLCIAYGTQLMVQGTVWSCVMVSNRSNWCGTN